MQIRIKRLIEKVPGGMMVVPLLTGAIINTFFPETPKFFGSFTGALFNPMPTLAAFFVCRAPASTSRRVLKKGSSLFLTKIGIGATFGLIFGHFLGEAPISGGMFAGLSTLAIVAAIGVRAVSDHGDARNGGAGRVSVAGHAGRHPSAADRHGDG